MSFAVTPREPTPVPLVPVAPVALLLQESLQEPCSMESTQADPRLSNVILWLGYVGGSIVAYKPIRRTDTPKPPVWATPDVQMPIGAAVVVGITNLPVGVSTNPLFQEEWLPRQFGPRVSPGRNWYAVPVYGGPCFRGPLPRRDIIAQHLEFLGISGR